MLVVTMIARSPARRAAPLSKNRRSPVSHEKVQVLSRFAAYSWLVGTLVKPHGEQRFQSLEQLEGAAPEVIEALKATFDDLERTETHDAAQSKEETAKN
jgi:hypothetical protein